MDKCRTVSDLKLEHITFGEAGDVHGNLLPSNEFYVPLSEFSQSLVYDCPRIVFVAGIISILRCSSATVRVV